MEVRKRLISQTVPSPGLSAQAWLNVDRLASVEITSEENGYPIEFALLRSEKRGWRAGKSGAQIIRLISCDGPRIPNTLFEKSYANSGILVSPTQYGRQRTMLLKSPELRRLN